MRHEQLLTNAKWTILAALAKEQGSATEIAAEAKTSLPNVSQQLKLLEAYGFAKPRKEEPRGPGKPKVSYSLAKEFAHIALVRRGFAGKRALTLDDAKEAMLKIWFLDRQEDQYCLAKLYWQEEALFTEALGVAVVEAKEQEVHLLVLVEEAKLDEFRKRYSKMAVACPEGKKRNVISWTHTVAELREGLERQDNYYLNLVKRFHALIEREDVFAEFR